MVHSTHTFYHIVHTTHTFVTIWCILFGHAFNTIVRVQLLYILHGNVKEVYLYII